MCAPPMIVASDAIRPIFGASMTAGTGFLNPLTRLRNAPPVQEKMEWLEAIGVPTDIKGKDPNMFSVVTKDEDSNIKSQI